ncbi:MAG: c-type cytochrome [Vicinamibacterales bacterium]
MRVFVAALAFVALSGVAGRAQDRPVLGMADSDTILVLKGLDVHEFENEMRQFNQALGVNCGFCHMRGDFTSDGNPRKLTARKMIEMTQALNKQFFPVYTPKAEESSLGRVTCYTCHQGSQTPPTATGSGGR